MVRTVNGVVISADIKAVREASRRSSAPHWFTRSTLRFFSSRIHSTIYGATYFVTSESDMNGFDRRFTVRKLESDGTVSTVGEFRQYASRSGAHAAAAKLAKSL